jgi:ketosteroid isomerase-like protein
VSHSDPSVVAKRTSRQVSSGTASYDLELVAAGACGDLAYTVGFEHKTFVVAGEPVSYTLRVTHVYRREGGVWRIVHRHGDRPPEMDASMPG